MKFTGQFVTAKLNIPSYERYLKKYLKEKLRYAASLWLEAVTGRVPVWSGMARGSLWSVAEFSGEVLVITPKKGVPSRIAEGKRAGSLVEDDFNITITTSVPHYVKQEYENIGISKSAPWQSFAAGKSAVLPYLKEVRLPAPILKKQTKNI